jgi:hypothetical protein
MFSYLIPVKFVKKCVSQKFSLGLFPGFLFEKNHQVKTIWGYFVETVKKRFSRKKY